MSGSVPPTGHCAQCQAPFWESPRGRHRIYCSHKCAQRASRARIQQSGPSRPGRKPDHCQRGHPMSGENIKSSKNGSHYCRECHRLRARRWYHETFHGEAIA